MFGGFFNRRYAGYYRYCVFQLGWRVGRATGFTTVTVLIFGAAIRAGAFDEAVGQEHIFNRIVGLLNLAPCDMAFGIGRVVNSVRALFVLGRVRCVVVVKAD